MENKKIKSRLIFSLEEVYDNKYKSKEDKNLVFLLNKIELNM